MVREGSLRVRRGRDHVSGSVIGPHVSRFGDGRGAGARHRRAARDARYHLARARKTFPWRVRSQQRGEPALVRLLSDTAPSAMHGIACATSPVPRMRATADRTGVDSAAERHVSRVGNARRAGESAFRHAQHSCAQQRIELNAGTQQARRASGHVLTAAAAGRRDRAAQASPSTQSLRARRRSSRPPPRPTRRCTPACPDDHALSAFSPSRARAGAVSLTICPLSSFSSRSARSK